MRWNMVLDRWSTMRSSAADTAIIGVDSSSNFVLVISQFALKLDNTNTDASPVGFLERGFQDTVSHCSLGGRSQNSCLVECCVVF